MKRGILSTASLNLQSQRWNSFIITPGAAYAAIAAPAFTIADISSCETNALGGNVVTAVTFNLSAGVVPSWCKEGIAVTIAGNLLTVGTASTPPGSVSIAGSAIVRDVKSDGTTLTVVYEKSKAPLTVAQTNVAINGGSVTLIPQAQKVMFTVPSNAGGGVWIADSMDAGGNVGWNFLIPATTPPTSYEVTAQVGGKFDILDWVAKLDAGTPTLMIRFL